MLNRFLIAFFGLCFLSLVWYFQGLRPVTVHSSPEVEFEITQGESIDQIGNKLSTAKLIRSRTAFKITVVRLGLASKIQAGIFKISPNMDTTTIAQKLTKALSRQVRITIPEGLRRQEIALIIYKGLKAANSETSFSTDLFLSSTDKLEGQLYPDTYDFDPKSDTQTVISRLIDTYSQTTANLKIPTDKLKDVTVIASLLEREAGNATEMPEISGVIQNRLRAGWPLQIDASVQYILGGQRCKKVDCDWWPKNLTKADLRVKSPFNTYANPGLPPSPISNPGKESLKAANSPISTPNWFYLHDNDGKIHFAKTVEEHNNNVCLYLKKDCR